MLNKIYFHAELHGNEIIGSFFFSQLVAQALAIFAVILSLTIEKAKSNTATRNLSLIALIFLITGIHLLPALEILGVFLGLVVLDVFAAKNSGGGKLTKNIIVGSILILLAITIVIFHPTFLAMKKLSENNGALPLLYIFGLRPLGWFSAFVAVISWIMIFKWLKIRDENKKDFLAIKYIGLYGISITTLCFLQIIALNFGYGSQYAVKKYAFGLFTVLVIEISLLAALFVRSKMSGLNRFNYNSTWSFYLLPLLLISGSYFCSIPSGSKLYVHTLDVVSLERQVQLLRETTIPMSHGKYDVAVKLADMPSVINYMISIGILETPKSIAGPDILMGTELDDLSTIGTIVTSQGSKPYDVPSCRRFSSNSSIILLDSSCVGSRLADRDQDFFDFSANGAIRRSMIKGFSMAEDHGRWTDGYNATFSYLFPHSKQTLPRTVKINATAFLYGTVISSQRVVIQINDSIPVEIRYNNATASQVIELPIPNILDEKLNIHFSLPDAVSPKKVGINQDERKLGIYVHSIEFK